MSSHELIDAQFDRAVEIVQNLPKTGPIQTGYEEKLAMYRCTTLIDYFISIPLAYIVSSLYKQGEPYCPGDTSKVTYLPLSQQPPEMSHLRGRAYGIC